MSASDAVPALHATAAQRGLRRLLAGRPGLVDASIAAGYLLVLLPGLVHAVLFPDPAHSWQGPVALASTVGNGAALLLRRRAPILTLTAAIVFTLLVKTLICGTPDPLGLALAGYAAGAHLPSRRAWVVLPAAIALVALAIIVCTPLSSAAIGTNTLLVINLEFLIPAGMLGLLVRARSSLRDSEERRLAHAWHEREQEAELTVIRAQTALSREIHDVVGHSLTAIINISDGALRVSATRPEVSDESLRRINQLARDGLGETRAILGALRPDGHAAPRTPAPLPRALPPPGVVDAAADAGLGLRELLTTAENAGLVTRLVIHGGPPSDTLSDDVRTAAHRIVQEAITNTMRHADGASAVTVTVTYTPDDMTIQVYDDGATPSDAVQGSGLRGASQRAEALGGCLYYGPAPVRGWHVTAVLPLRRGEQ